MEKMKRKKLNNKIHVIPSEHSKQFIENFNKNKPTKEFVESCKKAGKLFSNETDVSSGDTISRAEVLALINKAMYNTDNKDIQDYLFCGLRRDVHNLPTIESSGDLISRAEAIEAIQNAYCKPCKERGDDHNEVRCRVCEYDNAIIQIDALPSVEKPIVNDCDLINRADAIKTVHKYFVKEIEKTPHEIDEDGDDVYTDMTTVNSLLVCNKELSKALKALPSADRPQVNSAEWVAEKEREFEELNRPKGEWIVENHEVVCSVCGQNNLETNFCPNCGADMKGGAK